MKPIILQLRLTSILAATFMMIASISSCKKYLDLKPDKSIVTPSTFDDLQSLMNADYIMNANLPVAGELACDDYYLSDNDYNSLDDPTGMADYIWQSDAKNDHDWQYSYSRIFNANVVLSNVDKINRTGHSEADWNRLKGTALFFRSVSFFELTQVFTLPYDKATSSSEEGIPLKTSPDITDPTVRSTLEETFTEITADLKEAATLLPALPDIKTQPSKAGCYGGLARIYLVMHDYDNAKLYADSFLAIHSALTDYNTLDATSYAPIPRFSDEVIFHSMMTGSNNVYPGYSKADSTVYASYAENDLRKDVFYTINEDGSAAFKGDYGGGYYGNLFAGIATDEILLIRAECLARENKPEEALNDLNLLLSHRYKTGTFVPYSNITFDALMQLIFAERRKELIFRGGLRWMDIRRLNAEGRYTITLKRVLNGTTYTLEPGDKRFAFLIPVSVIQLSGIKQNER